MPEQTQTPRVLWAQQHETVLLTIAVPDINQVVVKFNDDSVHFRGQSTSGSDKSVYAVSIDLYGKIDPDACKYENIGQKYWRLLLQKKDSNGAYWPRLTKEKARLHWLQTDFDHWKDEEESDDERAGLDGNFQDMLSGGQGGMSSMDDEGEEDEEEDYDEEEEGSDEEENAQHSQQTKTSTNNQGDSQTSVQESTMNQ